MHRLTEATGGQLTARPICIPHSHVKDIWPRVEGYLDKAMRRNDLGSIVDVRTDVLAGDALLWITWDGEKIPAALVTKIIKPHTTKACILVACGGKGNWPVLIESIEDYARIEGCAVTRIYGPRAWLRVLKNYKATRFIMESEL
jgi:hypothetical protein